jgi:hypothetical protein
MESAILTRHAGAELDVGHVMKAPKADHKAEAAWNEANQFLFLTTLMLPSCLSQMNAMRMQLPKPSLDHAVVCSRATSCPPWP